MATPDEQAMQASMTGGVLEPADTTQEKGIEVAGVGRAILPAILDMIRKSEVDVPISEGATQARGADVDVYQQQQRQTAPKILSEEGQARLEEAGGRVDNLINPPAPDPVVESAREALDAAPPGDATVRLDAKRQLNYAQDDGSLRPGSTDPYETGAATEIDAADFVRFTEGAENVAENADVNFNRINSSDDIKATINFFSERFGAETAQARRGVVKQTETEQEASKLLQDELGLTRDLLQGGPGRVLNAAQMTAVRILLQKSGDRLVTMATEIRRGNRDPEFLVAFRRQMALHAGIQQQATAAQTEIARALNAFNIPVSARTPEMRTEFADTLLGESGSAQGAIKLANGLLDARARAAEHGKNPNAAMNKYAQKGAYALTMDAINQLYINGLLSWFPTHIKNFFATPAFMILRNVEEMFAGLTGTVDRGVRRAFGREVADQEVYLGQALARMFGQVHSFKEALIIAGESMKRGESPDLMNKVELAQHNAISSEAFANSKVQFLRQGMNNHHFAAFVDILGKIITLPGRALMGADAFWKVMSQQGELASQAYHNAARARARGAGYEDALDQAALTIIDPRASQAAIIDSAQLDTMTSDLSRAALPGAEVDIRKYARALQNIPIVGRMLTPFTTAPTNTVLRYLERTPLGLANMFRREDGELAFKNPAARNRIMARVSLSTGVMFTMHNLAMEGHFTGAMPMEANQRRKLPPGWQPYSFVMKANGWPKDAEGEDLPLYNPITGAYNGPVTYVSYAGLEPVSMILGTAANTAEMMRRTNDPEAATNYVSAAVGSVAQYIGDMPMLQTIASIVKSTMYDDYSFVFNSPLGNLLPYSSAVRNIERFVDPEKRRPSKDFQYYTLEDVAKMSLHEDGTQRTELIGTLKGPTGFTEISDFGKYLQEYRQQLVSRPIFGVDEEGTANVYDVMGRKQDYGVRFDVNPVLATYNLISPFRIKKGEALSLAMSEHIRLGAPLRDRITSKNGMRFDQAFQSDWMNMSKNEVLVVKGGKSRKFRDALDWLVKSRRYNLLSSSPEKQRNEIIKLENEFFNEGFNVTIGMEKYDDVRRAYEDLLATPKSSQVIR